MEFILDKVGTSGVVVLIVLCGAHVVSSLISWRRYRRTLLDAAAKRTRLNQAFLHAVREFVSCSYRAVLVFLILYMLSPRYPAVSSALCSFFVVSPLIWVSATLVHSTAFHYMREGKELSIPQFLAFNASTLTGAFNTTAVLVALILLYNVSSSPPYVRTSELSPKMSAVQGHVARMNRTIADLGQGVSSFSQAADSTLVTITDLNQTLSAVEHDFAVLVEEKNELDRRVELMQQRTEEELRKDAIYIAINDVLTGSRVRDLGVGFTLGLIASLMANFFTMRYAGKKGP